MRVAVLGLGAMGARMAHRLLAAGHDIAVWNRSGAPAAALGKAGARVAETPAAAAAGAQVALSMVRDDDAARRVWLGKDGALGAMGAGAVAVESSTVTPVWARELAAACETRGVGFLDAPVLGSRRQAETGTLIHVVGGRLEDLHVASEILEALSEKIHHVGLPGAGAALKLVANALLGVQVALYAELLGVLEGLKVERERAVDVLSQTPPCSPAARAALQAMLAQNHSPAFPVELLAKDLAYLVDPLGDVRLPVTSGALEVFRRAIDEGLAAENMTAAARLYP